MTEAAYELRSGEDMHRQHPATFHLPPRQKRESLQPGASAKLLFVGTVDGQEVTERMWINVIRRVGDRYEGELESPASLLAMRPGDGVEFGPEHVIQIFEAANA